MRSNFWVQWGRPAEPHPRISRSVLSLVPPPDPFFTSKCLLRFLLQLYTRCLACRFPEQVWARDQTPCKARGAMEKKRRKRALCLISEGEGKEGRNPSRSSPPLPNANSAPGPGLEVSVWTDHPGPSLSASPRSASAWPGRRGHSCPT